MNSPTSETIQQRSIDWPKQNRVQRKKPEAWPCPQCYQVCEWNDHSVGDFYLWQRDICACETGEMELRKERAGEVKAQKRLERAMIAATEYLALPLAYQSVTFGSLKVDEHNRKAVTAAKKWAAVGMENKTGLFIHGDTGTGKTWLAAAILNDLLNRQAVASHPVCFLNAARFLRECRKFEHGQVAHWYDCHLLILDDLGSEATTDFARERIYDLVSERYDAGLLMMVTSNFDLDGLRERFEARVSSRLAQVCSQIPLLGKDRRL